MLILILIHLIEFSTELQNVETSLATLLKKGSIANHFPAILKSLLTLTKSICGGADFQYSYKGNIGHVELFNPLVPDVSENCMKCFFKRVDSR